jgi:hypothetical protein
MCKEIPVIPQGGGQEKNNWKKMEGLGGDAQGVADKKRF